MPPTRTTRSSAAPKLKQAKLSFNASKRGASANTAKPAKASVARTSSTPVLSRRADSSSSSISADSSSSDHTDDDDDIEVVEAPRKSTGRPPPAKAVINVDAEVEHLDVKDRRWDRAHQEAKELRGTPLVHAEGQNKVHDILRVFDMTYKYGPYVGVTRLERWERANNLGLNPPPEIRDILLTHEGRTLDEYAQSAVFGKGDVMH
ncbi:hypothetical protein K525DRAFT_234143 [Schizophyllum commune Loenen D]|nr:hypothetical protein K525DRAFT_234143 [Schizophyllum commune Loenen D]